MECLVFQPLIREGAAAALRAALVVTSQRETKERGEPPQYYRVRKRIRHYKIDSVL